jgi:hypothetical protein
VKPLEPPHGAFHSAHQEAAVVGGEDELVADGDVILFKFNV